MYSRDLEQELRDFKNQKNNQVLNGTYVHKRYGTIINVLLSSGNYIVIKCDGIKEAVRRKDFLDNYEKIEGKSVLGKRVYH